MVKKGEKGEKGEIDYLHFPTAIACYTAIATQIDVPSPFEVSIALNYCKRCMLARPTIVNFLFLKFVRFHDLCFGSLHFNFVRSTVPVC